MRVGLPCKFGEELTDGYFFEGFDKGLYTATLYGRRPGDEHASFFREDAFSPKYVLDLPFAEKQVLSKLGLRSKKSGELFGIKWDGGKAWADIVLPVEYYQHLSFTSDEIDQLIGAILPDTAA